MKGTTTLPLNLSSVSAKWHHRFKPVSIYRFLRTLRGHTWYWTFTKFYIFNQNWTKSLWQLLFTWRVCTLSIFLQRVPNWFVSWTSVGTESRPFAIVKQCFLWVVWKPFWRHYTIQQVLYVLYIFRSLVNKLLLTFCSIDSLIITVRLSMQPVQFRFLQIILSCCPVKKCVVFLDSFLNFVALGSREWCILVWC